VISSSPPQASSGRLDELLAEHAALEQQLADPAVHADAGRARSLGRRYAELSAIVEAARAVTATSDDLATVRELAGEDATFAAEAEQLETRLASLEERLHELLVPRDPDDGKDAILEVKAGEGGEESALFAGDLLRMYLRFAERQGWSAEVLDSTESDLGGYKDVSVALRSKTGGVFGRLKFEGGVHRVQRVPSTESSGRIHTSTATVIVMPEADEVEVEIDEERDLRIEVKRSSGPGGQSVNTTDSAVRITHIPSGLVVEIQDEKSQHKNKAKAMSVLRSRLYDLELAKQRERDSATRRTMVQAGDRSEKIRTYNFPDNRVTDHRIGTTIHNVPGVLEGQLDPLIDALVMADQADRLRHLTETDDGPASGAPVKP
jgi:peptide chain release factor 1